MKKPKPLRFKDVIPRMSRVQDDLNAEVDNTIVEHINGVDKNGEEIDLQRVWVFSGRYQKYYVFPVNLIYVVRERPADKPLLQTNWSHLRFWESKHPPAHAILVIEETPCTSLSANTVPA